MKRTLRNAGLVAGLFFPLAPSPATTFGPIPVYQQAENTRYYVHGHVVGAPETRFAPRVNQPYTYWHVQITDQPFGEPLGAEVLVRSPGGEVGDHGYRVAGSAEFAEGEDVFIALRDVEEEPSAKEVVGLASGKFRVEAGPGGKQIVVSGLGMAVTGGGGETLTPQEFSSLLRRLARKEATDADRNVFVNRAISHGQEKDPEAEPFASGAKSTPRPEEPRSPETQASSPSPKNQGTAHTVPEAANPVQQSTPATEEPSTGFSSWGWILALGVLGGLIFGLWLLLRR